GSVPRDYCCYAVRQIKGASAKLVVAEPNRSSISAAAAGLSRARASNHSNMGRSGKIGGGGSKAMSSGPSRSSGTLAGRCHSSPGGGMALSTTAVSGTGWDPLQHDAMEGDSQIAVVGMTGDQPGRHRRVRADEGEVSPVTPLQ